MCTVSNVGDHYGKIWEPYVQPTPPTIPGIPTTTTTWQFVSPVTREEFDALKRDVKECLRLLKMAKEIDTALGEPDCEMDEKVAIIKAVAEGLGVDLEDVFGEG